LPRRSGFVRGLPARTSVPRRQTSWSLGPGGDDLATLDLATITTSGLFILGSGITPVVSGLTLVRLHGFIELQLTGVAAAGDGFSYAAGVGIVTDDAFAVGASAIPSPFDDISWNSWLWHRMGAVHTPTSTVDDVVAHVTIPIESKAMRKFGPDNVMMLVMQFGETGTSTLLVRAATRVLFKLQ